MLLLFILLSSCNGANFSNLKITSLKTFEEDKKEKSNKRDVNYVIGEDNKEDKKEFEKDQRVPNAKINYLESSNLLDILDKEKKEFEKVQKDGKRSQKLDIDYLDSKTLIDILDEEKKNYKISEDEEKKSSKISESNKSSYESDLFYGYEKTVGYEDEFFC